MIEPCWNISVTYYICNIILLFVFQYYVLISEKIQAEGRAGMDEKSLYPFDESKLGQIFFIS